MRKKRRFTIVTMLLKTRNLKKFRAKCLTLKDSLLERDTTISGFTRWKKEILGL